MDFSNKEFGSNVPEGQVEWIEGSGEQPPESPPVAQIVSVDPVKGLVVAEGVIQNVNWDITTKSPVSPDIKWPEPVTLGNERTLRFLTDIPATYLYIDSYDEIHYEPNGDLSEHQEIASEFVCVLSGANPCERITPDGIVEYHKLPQEVLQHQYIVVYGTWDIPNVIKITDGEPELIYPEGAITHSVTAHWMFRLTRVR